ncbi:MAG: ferritin family protein [bacterium]
MDKEKSLKGIKIALQTELNGIEFYRIAAEKTEDKKGKKVFQMLADDEVKHYNELKRQYQHLIQDDHWFESTELAKPPVFADENPIFSEELKNRIQDRHFEMSALSIGALLETNSISFYRKMKEEADDPVARQLFENLQKWEERHLEAITKQLDLLKEEYWADAHFTPLY